MDIVPESPLLRQILEQLKSLEGRIARIESHLELSRPPNRAGSEEPDARHLAAEDDEELELRLGQNWFAKAGIVGLALGIAFLLTLPYRGLSPILPSLLGYVIVGGLLFLSHYWRESFPQVSRYLLGGGLLLLYFTTLRLSYFGPIPALESSALEQGLLLTVVAGNILVAVRQRSRSLTALILPLGFLTALLGEDPVFVLAVIALLSAATAYLVYRFRWNALLIVGILLTYSTHLIWSAGNPVLGNALQFGLVPPVHMAFVLLYTLIYASAVAFRRNGEAEKGLIIASGVMNGLGGFGLFALSTLVVSTFAIVAWNALASALFLALAILFWVRERSVYSTFVYAMLGYAALSAAIIAQFPMPDFFVWLSWQSILVVSTAVWFRSRFIIVANFCIYLTIFLAYLFFAPAVSIVSVSFGVVALLSARILNWQKDRLVLKTELMRNAYLASALLFLPYALFRTVPAQFVSVSWLVLALFYYVASRLLKSRKYRWMALLTMSLTILYVFIVDLTAVDPVVRIVSFLAVGSALLGISMFYSRKKRRSVSESSEGNTEQRG